MKKLALLLAIIILSCQNKSNKFVYRKTIVYKHLDGNIIKDTLSELTLNNGDKTLCYDAYSSFLLDSLKFYSKHKEIKTNDSLLTYSLQYQNGASIDCSHKLTKKIKDELLQKAKKELATIEYRYTEEYKADVRKYREAKASEKISTAEFEKYLSSWDGSFPPLKDYLKENLNDPSSFEHVKTGFITRNGWVEVKMTYRAKNSFGALVKEAIVAKASNDGKLLEITQVIN